MRGREAKLCQGVNSPLIALGIELGVEDDDLGDMYRLLVQVILGWYRNVSLASPIISLPYRPLAIFYSNVVKVVDLEKGEMLVQHHFGLAERIDSQLKVWSSFEKPLFKYVDHRLLYSCPGVDLT